MRRISPRSSRTRFGSRKPSVVTRSTAGWAGQRASRAWTMRAVLLFPTATLPAMPITYGTRAVEWPRKRAVAWYRAWEAVT